LAVAICAGEVELYFGWCGVARPIMVVTDSISSTTRKDSARRASVIQKSNCSAELGRGIYPTERDSIVKVEDVMGSSKLSIMDIVL